MKKFITVLIVTVMLILPVSIPIVSAETYTGNTAQQSTCYIEVERDYDAAYAVLELVNKEREAAGLNPVKMNEALLDAAMQRAGECAVFFSHTRPTGASKDTITVLQGCLENIAINQITPEQVMSDWMNSEGHRFAILYEDFNAVGIGVVIHNGYTYWVQEFGNKNRTANFIKPENDTIIQEVTFTNSFDGYEFSPKLHIYDPANADSFTYFEENTTLKVGQQRKAIMMMWNPGAGSDVIFNNKNIEWESIGNSVILDSNMNIIGVHEGTATISATFSGTTYSKTVTVEDSNVTVAGHNITTSYNHNKTHTEKCEGCDYKKTEKCTFDTGKITKEPTASSDGVKTYTCNVCKGTYTEPVKYEAPVVTEGKTVYRIYGSTRFETSYAIADAMKAELGVSKFSTVIVANGMNYPDALAGSYLSAKKEAPILMVNTKSKDSIQALQSYIKKNVESGGKIYILGGTRAVSDEVKTGLSGYTFKRLSGQNRYDTNLAILEEAGVKNEDILVCTGTGFADSLSGSATGLPILLVGESLTDAQKNFLKSIKGNDFYIIGGTAAVNETVEKAIAQYGTTERISGKSRYQTSIKLAEKFFPDATEAVVAYAWNFPDGLCGGPLAFNIDAPLILTGADMTKKPSEETQKTAVQATVDYMKLHQIDDGAVLGGAGVLTDYSVKLVFDMSAKETIIDKMYK